LSSELGAHDSSRSGLWTGGTYDADHRAHFILRSARELIR
jgi:hypothetical protein